MTTVVSDTGPLRYLVLIEAIDILPILFGRVLIPEIVAAELTQPGSPPLGREWLSTAPAWLGRRSDPTAIEKLPPQLDAGERGAIGLAQAVGNALLLIDDRAGIEAARMCGIDATGTLGVLVRAAQRGLVDLRTAFGRLETTNFRYRRELLHDLLTRHEAGKR